MFQIHACVDWCGLHSAVVHTPQNDKLDILIYFKGRRQFAKVIGRNMLPTEQRSFPARVFRERGAYTLDGKTRS